MPPSAGVRTCSRWPRARHPREERRHLDQWMPTPRRADDRDAIAGADAARVLRHGGVASRPDGVAGRWHRSEAENVASSSTDRRITAVACTPIQPPVTADESATGRIRLLRQTR